MSVFIVRTFIRLREMVQKNDKLSRKVEQLEKRVSDHDHILFNLVREIRKLVDAPDPKPNKRSIGFIVPGESKKIHDSGERPFCEGRSRKSRCAPPHQ